MTASNKARAARLSPLAKSLMTETRATGQPSEDKRYLSGVTEVDGMTATDVEYAEAARQVATLSVAEVLKSAAAALKSATVDPDRVTLRTTGNGKVSANLPVPYVVDGVTRHVNLTVSLGDKVGEILSPFAQRVSK